MRISSQGAEWVHATVTVDDAAPDPSLPVVFAFLAAGAHPDAGTVWVAAEWADGRARLLVGPGGHQLDVGDYAVYVRVIDDPEVPVLRAGFITVY